MQHPKVRQMQKGNFGSTQKSYEKPAYSLKTGGLSWRA